MVQMRSERLTTERHWNGSIPTLRDVYAARAVVRQYLAPTPLIESEALSAKLGFDVLIKCESLNPTGAFKVRGGIYYMSQLDPARRARGVVAASTGNHGQSIAYAAKLFGVRAIVVVPKNANPLKVAAMRDLGAEVVFHGADFDEAREHCAARAESESLRYVHSANEPHLIAGVATIALEILEEAPDVTTLIVPVGGGSGASGACLVAKTLNPKIKVIGVQAERAPAAYKSWKSHELLEDKMETAAEGLATRVAFEMPQEILWQYLDDFILVTENEMSGAVRLYIEKAHTLVEAAGAASLAAALKLRDRFAGETVALVLSGGNITAEQLRNVLAANNEERLAVSS